MIIRNLGSLIAGFLLATGAWGPALATEHGSAAAGPKCLIADPAQSIFPQVLGRSPKNLEVESQAYRYTYRGTLMCPNGNPIAGWPASDIELEILAPCQNPITLHPDGPSGPQGEVTWGAAKMDQAGGGACHGSMVGLVRVLSIGVFQTLTTVVSPDINGNLQIGLDDFGMFQQAFVSGGPLFQGDLDLSGGPPDLGDLLFFQKHFAAP
jgi:hypothetical protein